MTDKLKREINLVFVGLDKIEYIKEFELMTEKQNECIDRINMLIDIQNEHLSRHWRNER